MSDPVRRPLGGGVLDEDSHGAGELVAKFVIKAHASGALSIEGPIENREWALAVLENAKDAINNHHARRAMGLIVPAKDVSVPKLGS
jgi:hypothetical protein